MLPILLHIETGGSVCSVAISEGEKLLVLKESSEGKAHASLLSVYIDEALKSSGLSYKDINAVVVNKGPGSYTGLRIGVATAKGLCFGLNIPLIAVDSLLSLTNTYFSKYHPKQIELYRPMLDARRMEVYTALFDNRGIELSEIEAIVVDEYSFLTELEKTNVVFFGDGAEKCKGLIKHPNAVFIDHIQASATGMLKEGFKRYVGKNFENTAYFEPFYLKDFIITQSKKKIL